MNGSAFFNIYLSSIGPNISIGHTRTAKQRNEEDKCKHR